MGNKGLVYVNGRCHPPEKARVSALDRGFLFGFGVFETMRAYGGVIFLLERHLERLEQSAALTGIPLPHTAGEFERILYKVIMKSGVSEAYLRLIVTPGAGQPVPAAGEKIAPTVVIICRPVPAPPEKVYRKGVEAIVAGSKKVPASSLDPRIKSHSYLPNVLARAEAVRAGAHEAFLADSDGFLTEGAMSSVFVVKGGALMTPPLEAGILEGTRRGEILRLAGEAGIKVREKPIRIRRIFSADECFFTTAVVEVMPVVRLDGRPVGPGRPGPLTKKVHKLLRKSIAGYCKNRR
ncbi:MAG: aminotransferase class IV [bacterium]